MRSIPIKWILFTLSLTPKHEGSRVSTNCLCEAWEANKMLSQHRLQQVCLQPGNSQHRVAHKPPSCLISWPFLCCFKENAGVKVGRMSKLKWVEPLLDSWLRDHRLQTLQKLAVFEQWCQNEGCCEEHTAAVWAGEFSCWASSDGVGDTGLVQLMVLRESGHSVSIGLETGDFESMLKWFALYKPNLRALI